MAGLIDEVSLAEDILIVIIIIRLVFTRYPLKVGTYMLVTMLVTMLVAMLMTMIVTMLVTMLVTTLVTILVTM